MANVLDLGRVALDGADLNTLDYLSYDSTNQKIDASKPIVETMSGYSVVIPTITNLEIENVYAGVCKNGNKITFVTALNITRTDSVNTGSIIARMDIPSSIGSKLYTTKVGAENTLDIKRIGFYSSIYGAPTDINITVGKTANTRIYLTAIGLNNLTANTKYYMRHEVTFLLSDNLISE